MKPSIDFDDFDDQDNYWAGERYRMCDYVSYYYDDERNVMIDEDGTEIFNIFEIIPPNMLYLFKTKKQDMFVYGVDGQYVELVYPFAEDHL